MERMEPRDFGRPEQERAKWFDGVYCYRGYYDREPEGVCRVRIFERGGEAPVLLITDLPENETTSVTNMTETLVPEIIRELMSDRFEHEEPVVVIEHLPAMQPERGKPLREYRRVDEYSRVSFASWRPRVIWMGGRERLSLGEPEWRHLPAAEVAALIGRDEMGE